MRIGNFLANLWRMPLSHNYRERVTYCWKHQLLLLNFCHQSGFYTLLRPVPPKQEPRKIAYILIELAFSAEIFSKRRKICVSMKKAHTWWVDYYTDCFKVTSHLIVGKIRGLHIPHCIKSHPYRKWVKRKWLPRGTQERRSLWYLEKFRATSKNWKISGKSFKNVN